MPVTLYNKNFIIGYLLHYHEQAIIEESQEQAENKKNNDSTNRKLSHHKDVSSRQMQREQSIERLRYLYDSQGDNVKKDIKNFKKLLTNNARNDFNKLQLHERFANELLPIVKRLHARSWSYEMLRIKQITAREQANKNKDHISEFELICLLQDPALRDNNYDMVSIFLPRREYVISRASILQLKYIQESFNGRMAIIKCLEEYKQDNSCRSLLSELHGFKLCQQLMSERAYQGDMKTVLKLFKEFKSFMHILGEKEEEMSIAQLEKNFISNEQGDSEKQELKTACIIS